MSDLQDALTGETPPLVTPFHADGDVDHAALESVVDHVRAGGVDGVFPCGTTGEFASLTATEQRDVIETVVDASGDLPVASLTATEQRDVIETVVDASGDLPVLAGVASTAVEDTVAKAEAAADAGADAAVVTAPYYHTPSDPAGIERYLTTVAERSPLPLLLYNIPLYVGTALTVETVASVAGHPNVVGMKDTSGELEYSLRVARETPAAFRVLQGYDTLLLPSRRMGLQGGINGLANVVPEVVTTIVDEPGSERARRASDALAQLFEICLDLGFAPVVKTALVGRGVIDRDTVRPPLTETPDEERERMATAVAGARDAI